MKFSSFGTLKKGILKTKKVQSKTALDLLGYLKLIFSD